MDKTVYIRGVIHFLSPRKKGPPLQKFTFQVSLPSPKVVETLMGNFKDLNFPQEEKRLLTQKCREKIQYFRGLSEEKMEREADKLIRKLKNHHREKIVIQADDVGAYICLVAIFSGKLPPEAPWKFELSAIPLRLFPSLFVKDKQAGTKRDIRFTLREDCWLKPFKSLHKVPRHLKF